MLCLLAHWPSTAPLHRSGFHPQYVQTFSISNLFHWLCIFFYFPECVVMRFYYSGLYWNAISMGLVWFYLTLHFHSSSLHFFLYPSQRPNTYIKIYVVQNSCWGLLWSSNRRSSKTSLFVLEWGSASCCTWKGNGTWLRFYMLLLFLPSLMRSHGKVSALGLLKILVR